MRMLTDNRQFTVVPLTYCVLLAVCVIAAQGEARAAVVAEDDFESYAEGSSLYSQGGGSGWLSNWAGNTESFSPFARAESGHIIGQGTSLVLGADIPQGSSNSNVLQREFGPQAGSEVYIGFTMQTESWQNDFFQLYVNDISNTGTDNSLSSSFNMGLTNSPNPSGYFLRKGGSNTTNSVLLHTNGVPHQMVVKLSKSEGTALSNYDEIALFVDQATEGTPTVTIDSTVGNNTLIGPELSVVHFRLGSQEPDEPLIFDNLKVATTYNEVLSAVVPEPTTVGLSIVLLSVAALHHGRRGLHCR